VTITNDRGIDFSGPATYSILTQNGAYGKVSIIADSGDTLNPLEEGGLIDIKALSFVGSSLPTALSRVNIEGATVSVSAGAYSSPPVPGALNLTSSLGSGVNIFTSLGAITITSGAGLVLTSATGNIITGGLFGTRFQDDIYAYNIKGYGTPAQPVVIEDLSSNNIYTQLINKVPFPAIVKDLSAGTIAINSINDNGAYYCFNGGLVANFTYSALPNDFRMFIKNCTPDGGAGNDITIQVNGIAITSPTGTSTLHQRTNTNNTAFQMLYFNGTNLILL
jgi:hypothetical protein